MAKYIALINWTDKGIHEVKDSAKRVDKARELAKSLGGSLERLYMTMGAYDLVGIIDFPNDEAAAKFALMSGAAGHIRTTTLKAFDEAEYRRIVESL
ncbi:MAG: GYD domain-containing protein [Hyphomicrobium sp.]